MRTELRDAGGGLSALATLAADLLSRRRDPSRRGAVRHPPEVWWLPIVLLFPLAGSEGGGRAASAYEHAVLELGEYDRPGRAVARRRTGPRPRLLGARTHVMDEGCVLLR